MIYANYAATTPALSQSVLAELQAYLGAAHFNTGRNFEGLDEGAIALRARRAAAALFGVSDPLRVVFTSGATLSLNMAINGFVRQGDHVLATSLEHNATARPLEFLRKNGFIELDWIPCDPDGSLDPESIHKLIKKNTRLLVITHASNVLGTILPVTECFKIAHEHGILTILDSAQTAGILPFEIDENDCDIVAFAGHKGLAALSGCGGLVFGKAAGGRFIPWISGGTGSVSHSLDMPGFLPDIAEPGTQNTIGILSIAASVEEILRIGVQNIRENECALTARFLSGLQTIKNIRVLGTLNPARCVPVVSVVVAGYDSAEISRRLFDDYGIITRSGLHCSPLAHKTAETFPKGTVRFSFGRNTTEGEIDTVIRAIGG